MRSELYLLQRKTSERGEVSALLIADHHERMTRDFAWLYAKARRAIAENRPIEYLDTPYTLEGLFAQVGKHSCYQWKDQPSTSENPDVWVGHDLEYFCLGAADPNVTPGIIMVTVNK